MTPLPPSAIPDANSWQVGLSIVNGGSFSNFFWEEHPKSPSVRTTIYKVNFFMAYFILLNPHSIVMPKVVIL
jgi:hypothetical protein